MDTPKNLASEKLLSSIQKEIEGGKSDELQFTILKRSGTLVPFRSMRITRALEAAFRDTKKIPLPNPIPSEMQAIITHLTQLVVEEASKFSKKGVSITVEGIQDIVEITLMKKGFHDVARDYIIYRDKHKAIRSDSPQELKVLRPGAAPARFNPMKISQSLMQLFKNHFKVSEKAPQEIIDAVNILTKNIVTAVMNHVKEGHDLHISILEDLIEEQLMKEGHFRIAKAYILARAGKKEENLFIPREEKEEEEDKKRIFSIVSSEGTKKTVTENGLLKRIKHACRGLEDLTSADELLEATLLNFYEGIKEQEIDAAMIMAARTKIEKEPAYSQVSARLLLDTIYRETLGMNSFDRSLEKEHKLYFKKYVKHGVSIERLSPQLLDFDLDKLGENLKLKRDDLFSYLGLQTLYDRYFIHEKGRRLETPQIFWMRVAMGLAIKEKEKTERAIEFYHLLSEFYYLSSTPTLFNSGTNHSQLSSCFLSTVLDDLSHIFKIISDDAQLSKWAGGLGNDWTNVRATGSIIKGTNGHSQGVIPFLKVANDTAVAVNQCFAPETLIYTSQGIKPIAKIKVGDLVLGVSGTYRQVMEKFAYNQKDPMVAISVKHSLEPISVTAGHPFYAIKGVPLEQANKRTLEWLKKNKVKLEWVEAGELKRGDYVAQIIPSEIIPVAAFEEDDARLYGMLLGDGHLSKDGNEWGISGNPQTDVHLEFVREYLRKRNIHFWETGRGTTYIQIRWAAGYGAVRDATTGRIIGSGAATLPFEYDDLYDAQGQKRIAPRLSHLPRSQTLALIQGLIETDGNISRGKEIVFSNTSQALVEGLRYQLLRLGIPTAGNFRTRQNAHTGKRSDGSVAHFKGITHSYDVRIPAIKELAQRVGATPLTKKNWLTWNQFLFTRVKKTISMPVSPFVFDLKVEGDESYMTTSGLAHNGGKRKGALCSYLETWHYDIEDFLDLRKNTGDERRRTHDMNTANWIPDLFMKRVETNGHWTLFSPSDVPDLHDLYGKAFENRYLEYEKMTEDGRIALFKRVEAVQLWRKMLSMLFETGHPWITFKDPSNIRSPQDHIGVVHSSNLCTEILLNTSKEETAVCNLGSVNLAKHMIENGIDEERLAKTIRTAIRMLDNVIDINFYPIVEASNSNLKHRPIGLGLMGFQDALYKLGISYASHEAVEFSDRCMEMISYYAILASSELAKERGTYESYKGSKWDRGILPIDSLDILEKERDGDTDLDKRFRMDWEKVRTSIKKHGMRNSNTMAIAPTATIANIAGVSASIEPAYKHLYVKSNLSGEFTVPNPYLIEYLKRLNLWDEQMLDDLKYYDGVIAEIDRIPEETKKLFLTAFEIDPEWLIECASRRQKWIDMGQSLNLYLAEPSGKKLHQMYMLAWRKGLKTTYYLRTLSATQIEKSTTDINKRGLQPRWMKHESPSSRIKVEREEAAKPIACNLEEGCESCQ